MCLHKFFYIWLGSRSQVQVSAGMRKQSCTMNSVGEKAKDTPADAPVSPLLCECQPGNIANVLQ